MSAALLLAGACSACAADRPLTLGLCEHCAPADPARSPRWLIRYGDVAAYVQRDETRDAILRLRPDAIVTDLRRVDCDPCGGSCEGRCDAGAGTWPERQAAELTEAVRA